MKSRTMGNVTTILLAAGTGIFLTACKPNKISFDASGSFEALETIVSSEATGTIRQLAITEGQSLRAGQFIGYIDSTQLFLRRKQLIAQRRAVTSRRPDVPAQLAALQSQLHTAQREQTRTANLVKGGAVPQKQLDDIKARVDLLHKQIAARQSSLDITTESISRDILPIEAQIAQLNDQLAKCSIINPVNGTVLAKYAEPNEMTVSGKPLYKIADLSTLILRAYITGDQLPLVRLNQQVQVLTDDGKGGYKKTTGRITWISDRSEFTPKTIQTKNERANMVYALKVKIKNDGTYKIGMYGEIRF